MDNPEPQIYRQLRQLVDQGTHFREALRLIARVHGICVLERYDGQHEGWGVDLHDNTHSIYVEFPTFSEAFEFVMGLMEVKG